MDGTRNLMVARSDKSVWDKPTLASSSLQLRPGALADGGMGLGAGDGGSRRGGLAGGLTAALGTTLAVRAAMGRHDLHVARRLFDRALSDRGWGVEGHRRRRRRGIVPGERLPVLDGRLRRIPRALTAELGDTRPVTCPRAISRPGSKLSREEVKSIMLNLASMPDSPPITYAEFDKVDIRVGRVVRAENFPEARKPAYKLLIDFGPDLGTRTSSAQLTRHYTVGDLEGLLVVAVVNFPPRQIGPYQSQVLTLGVPDADGGVVLLVPDKKVPIGGRLF